MSSSFWPKQLRQQLFLASLALFASFGPASAPAEATPTETRRLATDPDVAVVQPEFPGGDAELITFLGKNLRYPSDAWQAGVEGRVMISFWIDEQGRPYGFGVLESLHPSLDAEALRAMKLMPVWKPGLRDGKPAPMVVHVPVSFRRPVSDK